MTSPDAPWRVYLPEWLIAYTSDERGDAGKRECEGVYAEIYAGRVRVEDWQVVPADIGHPDAQQCLQLHLPNLQGEYKDEDAMEVPWAPGDPRIVVRRGSAEEQLLLDYGRKMLPAKTD